MFLNLKDCQKFLKLVNFMKDISQSFRTHSIDLKSVLPQAARAAKHPFLVRKISSVALPQGTCLRTHY